MKQFRIPAVRLLKENVEALRLQKQLHRKDLSWALGHESESTISKIYKHPERTFSIHDLDKLAEALGVETFQLFIPGVSASTEKRSGKDRRSGQERRVGFEGRQLATLRDAVNKLPRAGGDSDGVSAARLPAVSPEKRRILNQAERALSAIDAREQTSAPRPPRARKAVGDRTARRSHVDKSDDE